MNALIPIKTLLELSQPAMLLVDEAGIVLQENAGAQTMFAASDALIGQELLAVLSRMVDTPDGDLVNPVPANLHKLPYPTELHMRSVDAHPVYWQLQSKPFVFEGQNLYLIVINDRSAQRKAELELLASERKLHKMLDELSDYGIFVMDKEGVIVSWNKGAQQIQGYSAEDVLGKHISCLYKEENVDGIAPATMLDIALRDGKYEEDGLFVRKDGAVLWLNTIITPIYDDHVQLTGYIQVSRDISARKREELALSERSETFHGAFHEAPIGMMMVDLEWRVLRVNRSICEMLGYTEQELLARTFQELTHPEDITADLDLVRQMIAGDINDYRLEKRYFHKDGHVIWMLLSASLLKDANKIPLHFIFHMQDISEYKKIQKQISEYAYQDALTNLPNRRLLQDRLKLAVAQAKRYKRQLGLMFLDIDYFKTINDTYGHAFGDELIKAIAHRLTECVRGADTVCRLGGDEFVIVITDVNHSDDLTIVAEKILQNVSRPIWIDGTEANVTMSLGLAMLDADAADDAERLMDKADQALYEMKRAGRNGYRIYQVLQAEQA
jgi:diguanylate cyclase (GGDEF)-like protein/PAS domain S-box-containing protein